MHLSHKYQILGEERGERRVGRGERGEEREERELEKHRYGLLALLLLNIHSHMKAELFVSEDPISIRQPQPQPLPDTDTHTHTHTHTHTYNR